MQDYSIAFSFQPLYIVLGLLLLVAFSIFSYRRVKGEITPGKRKILTVIRSISFGLLLLLLSAPILSTTSTMVEEPLIAFFIDRSLSVEMPGKVNQDIAETNIPIKQQYRQSIDRLSKIFDGTELLFGFDDIHYKLDADSLAEPATGDYTNLTSPISDLPELYRQNNVRAAVILTDGNLNQGTNPISEAVKAKMPLYIIGIGDTNTYADIAISRISVPAESARNSVVPVSVEINWNAIDSEETTLSLYKDSLLVDTRKIVFGARKGSQTLDFTDLATEEGVYNYRAIIDTMPSEHLKLNNEKQSLNRVKILKKQIAVFAGAPSPDVSFITDVLRDLPDTELERFILKKDREYYNPPSLSQLDDIDALVLIDFPNQFTDSKTITALAKMLDKGIPMLFFAGKSTDWNNLGGIAKHLPFEVVQSNGREYKVQIAPSQNITSKTVFGLGVSENITESGWQQLPPLYRTETFVRPRTGSVVLANSLINNQKMQDPLVSSYQIGGSNVLAVLGYGVYSWKLNGYAVDKVIGNKSIDLLTKFITNGIGYLSVRDKSGQFQLRTNKDDYSRDDKVTISAQVRNDAMQPLNEANVEVKLTGTSDYQRKLVLTRIGLGLYSTTLDVLPAGSYQLSGTANFEGTPIGTDFTAFTVSEVSLEQLQSGMNIDLLKDLANSTGGVFYHWQNFETLDKDIKSANTYRSRSQDRKISLQIWHWTWLMIAILFFLAIEWSLRKKWGLL